MKKVDIETWIDALYHAGRSYLMWDDGFYFLLEWHRALLNRI